MPSPITALEEEDAGDSVSQMIDNAIGVRLKRETREGARRILPASAASRLTLRCVHCLQCGDKAQVEEALESYHTASHQVRGHLHSYTAGHPYPARRLNTSHRMRNSSGSTTDEGQNEHAESVPRPPVAWCAGIAL